MKQPNTMPKEKSVVYQTHWKNYFKDYVIAWALTPLLGVGFFLLRKLGKQLEKQTYTIFNDRIVTGSGELAQTVYFSELREVGRTQSTSQKKHGLSDITLKTDDREFVLLGLEQGEELEDVLYIAIESERRKRELREKAKGEYQQFKPGGLEQVNQLVGLWQQGMITDEQYRQEKEKYENKD